MFSIMLCESTKSEVNIIVVRMMAKMATRLRRRLARKLRRESVRRMLVCGRIRSPPLRHDATVLDADGAVGARSNLRIVGDHDDGLVKTSARFAKQREHLVAGRAVEISCRLVSENDLRLRSEGRGRWRRAAAGRRRGCSAYARDFSASPSSCRISSIYSSSGRRPSSWIGMMMFS